MAEGPLTGIHALARQASGVMQHIPFGIGDSIRKAQGAADRGNILGAVLNALGGGARVGLLASLVRGLPTFRDEMGYGPPAGFRGPAAANPGEVISHVLRYNPELAASPAFWKTAALETGKRAPFMYALRQPANAYELLRNLPLLGRLPSAASPPRR